MTRFKREFYNWLLSRRADQIVGRAGEGCNCPIANFVRANLAPSLDNPPGMALGEFVCVGQLDGALNIWARSGLRRQKRATLGTGWARRFTAALDMAYDPGKPVTSIQALRILALMQREPATTVVGGRPV